MRRRAFIVKQLGGGFGRNKSFQDVQTQEKVGHLGGSNVAGVDDLGDARVLGFGEVGTLLRDILHDFGVVGVTCGVQRR